MVLSFASFFLFFWALFFSCVSSVGSADLPNNIFGIHITDIHEAQLASELVNSNGGDWGYVTFVISSRDRDLAKWQNNMNILNKARLIPIVRIATYVDGDVWVKPDSHDAQEWAAFLSSLRWPTSRKIVVVYNEVNHGKEWGGRADPTEYAYILRDTIAALKQADSNFVVLNAGFDASAPHKPPRYMDQVAFMDAMHKAVPGIFSQLDGWASHSYPNPHFSGKVTDRGRGSIRTYEWELDLLKTRYKVDKMLDVYITETGWTSRNADHPYLPFTLESNAERIVQAYTQVWQKDSRVKAVTPFLLTYKQPLFSHFSWLLPDNSPSAMYRAIQALPKSAGDPQQVYDSIFSSVSIPPLIQKGREVSCTVTVQNTGHAIWSDGKDLSLFVDDPLGIISLRAFSDFRGHKVFPGQFFTFSFTLFYDQDVQSTSLQFQMKHGSSFFGEKIVVPVRIFQPPSLTLTVQTPPSRPIEGVQIEFINGSERDVLHGVSISPSGMVGTFSSYTFVPEQRTRIRVLAPDRHPVEADVLITEGAQTYTFSLPPVHSFWEKVFEFIKRWSNF